MLDILAPFISMKRPSKRSERLVSSTLMGGLGNKLFQVAAAIGYAKRKARRAVICTQYNLTLTQRGTEDYSQSVFSKIPKIKSMPETIFTESPQNAFTYVPITDSFAQHLHLEGYFQDVRYFADAETEVKEVLSLPPIQEIPETCFIHVRRGDYLSFSEHNLELQVHYLPRAIEAVTSRSPNAKFLVFSDDPGWCHWYFREIQLPVAISEETDPVLVLCQMAGCSVGGICWNSSFSWWGSYLGFRDGKTVVFPDQWYRDNDFQVTIQFPGSLILPAGG